MNEWCPENTGNPIGALWVLDQDDQDEDENGGRSAPSPRLPFI